MPDWAETKAREWLESLGGRLEGPGPISEAYGWLEVSDESAASLAALLREVAENNPVRDDDHIAVSVKSATLAEVRRVVEEQRDSALDNAKRLASWDGQADEARCRELAALYCDEILSRLEKL